MRLFFDKTGKRWACGECFLGHFRNPDAREFNVKHEVWFYDGSWHQPARTGHSDVWKDDTLAARIITAFLFCLSYWFCCFLGTGTDGKNLVGLRSYPDAVQAAVREHPMLGKAAPKEKSTLSILLGNLLLFTAVFSVLGFALKDVLGLRDFETAFWFFLVLGEGLGLFDLAVIDLLWWRNTKRIRFSFLQEKSCYQDPSKHIGSFLRGVRLASALWC